jgi:hypothetical protein
VIGRLGNTIRFPVQRLFIDFSNIGWERSGEWEEVTDYLLEVSGSKEKSGESLGSITSDLANFVVDNSDKVFNNNNMQSPFYQKIKPNLKFKLMVGFRDENLVEYASGYIEKFTPTWSSKKYSIKTTDHFKSFKKSEVPTTSYQDISWEQLVNILCDAAGLPNHIVRDIPATEFYYDYFEFEEENCFEALKKLLEVAVGSAYFEQGKFIVKTKLAIGYSLDTQVKHEITVDDMFTFDEIVEDAIINDVSIVSDSKGIGSLQVIWETPEFEMKIKNELYTYDGATYMMIDGNHLPALNDEDNPLSIKNITQGKTINISSFNVDTGRVDFDSTSLNSMAVGDILSLSYSYNQLALSSGKARTFSATFDQEVDSIQALDVSVWDAEGIDKLTYSTTPDAPNSLSLQILVFDKVKNVATFELKNNYAETVSISTLQLRGYPINIVNPIEVYVKDDPSIVEFERKEHSISNNYINNIKLAEKIATYIVDNNSHPRKRLKIEIEGYPEMILDDVTKVLETSSGINDKFTVEKIDYSFDVNNGWTMNVDLLELDYAEWTYETFNGESYQGVESGGSREQAATVYRGTTEPEDRNVLWIDTSVIPNIPKSFDESTGLWEKASPTTPQEIGAATPEDVSDALDSANGYTDQETGKRELAILKQSSTPVNPATGQLWIDINFTPNRLKRWDGSSWRNLTPISATEVGAESAIARQNTAPSHAVNKLWIDTSVTPNAIKRSDGTKWIKVTPTTASDVGSYTVEEVNTALQGKVAVTKYNTDMNGVTSQLESHSTAITQNEEQIGLRVTTQTYESDINGVGGIKERLSSTETSITANTEQIELRATKSDLQTTNSNVNGLTTRMNTAESSINTNAEQIALRVTKTTYDTDINKAGTGLKARVSTAESTITQQAEEIEAKVSKDGIVSALNITPETIKIKSSLIKIDGATVFSNGYDPTKIEVGGRNLRRNGDFTQGDSYWLILPTRLYDPTLEANYVSQGYGWSTVFEQNIEPSKEYTISCMAREGTNPNSVARFSVSFKRADGTLISNPSYFNTFTGTDWEKKSATFTTPAETKQIRVYLLNADSTGNAKIDFSLVKLEKGNKETDWTPAPEDVASYTDEKVTQSQMEALQQGKWSRTYDVNTSNPLVLRNPNGTAFDNNYSYEVTARVLGTGTDTLAVAHFLWNGSNHEVHKVQENGTSVNHPEFFVDGSGNPAIRLYDHSTLYTVSVEAQRWIGKTVPTLSARLKAIDESNMFTEDFVKRNTGNLVDNPTATGDIGRWISTYPLSVTNQDFFGVSVPVLESNTSSNAQNYSGNFNVDPSKAYLVSAWIKKGTAEGNLYLGAYFYDDISGDTLVPVDTVRNSTGTYQSQGNTNPYFWSGNYQTEWVQVVAYVMPSGTHPSTLKGIGEYPPVTSYENHMIMRPDTKAMKIRFLNWSNTSVNKVWVANVKVVEVDPNSIVKGSQAKNLTDVWKYPNSTYINGGQIYANSITANKMNVTELSSIVSNLGTVNAGTINGVEINGSVFRSAYSYTEGITQFSGSMGLTSEGIGFVDNSTNEGTYGLSKKSNRIDSLSYHLRAEREGIGSRDFHLDRYEMKWYGTGNGYFADFGIKMNLDGKTLVGTGMTYTQSPSQRELFFNSTLKWINDLDVGATGVNAYTGTKILESPQQEGIYIDDYGNFMPKGKSTNAFWSAFDHNNNPTMRFYFDPSKAIMSQRDIDMNNNNIINVNSVVINDPGSGEGIIWGGGNGWSMVEAPYGGTDNGAGFLHVKKNSKSYLDFGMDSTDFIRSPVIFDRTYTFSSNMYITGSSVMGRTTSSRRYKIEEEAVNLVESAKILNVSPKTWFDKNSAERYAEFLTSNGENIDEEDVPYIERIPGVVAEDVEAAGLERYVVYGDPNEAGERTIEGVMYDRLWTLLIPLVKEQRERIQILEEKVRLLEI